MEKWMMRNIKFDAPAMAKELHVSEVVVRILVNRGITSIQVANRFLNASINELYDPKLMKDIEKGARIIKEGIEKHLNVLVVGDYDVDGVISTYLLYTALKRCGADVSYHIPDRITEGYGINESIIRNAALDGIDIIITCDNGIAAIEQVKLAKELGMQVIITDHHDIQFRENDDGSKTYIVPEADAIINPKQPDCNYPFKYLCGAGIVFKFTQVLYEYMEIDRKEAIKLLEYVAIATVCDVVDLTFENRIIVKNGLEMINKSENIGLKALFEETGLVDKQISVYTLGFVIGPSINASGRLEQAIWALKLLLSEDYNEAKKIANKLHELNKERQDLTSIGLDAATEIIETSDIKNDKVLVIYIPDVHESIAGIIAGRIRERYNVPAFILTKGSESAKGSGRSIIEYNMFEELLKCSDLLLKYGGHPMAAGLSIEEENIELFRKRLNENCTLSDEDIIPKVSIDMQLPLQNITMKLAEELTMLEPFGKGNSKPLFAEKRIRIKKAMILGAKKNVLKLKINLNNGKNIDAIYFGDIEKFNTIILHKYGQTEYEKMFAGLLNKVEIDLVFSIGINEYMNSRTVQLVISSFR